MAERGRNSLHPRTMASSETPAIAAFTVEAVAGERLLLPLTAAAEHYGLKNLISLKKMS